MPELASVAVVVASRGRPLELAQLLSALRTQTQPPKQIILSLTQAEDAPPRLVDDNDVVVVTGPAGLCKQRNRGMDAVDPACEIIAFLDDDYVPRDDAVAAIAETFARHPDVVAVNGVLLADGIGGAGIELEEATDLLQRSSEAAATPSPLTPMEALYGCNMMFRRSAVQGLRFDEALPLYGWQEDIDFSAQLQSRGRVVKCHRIVGVHRGVKGSRVSGRRFGYSQIVNPVYLANKGTMRRAYAFKIMTKNVIANLFRALSPEPWVDRRGRLMGNYLGLIDIISGKAHPENILQA